MSKLSEPGVEPGEVAASVHTVTKPLLIAVSHAVESFALSASSGSSDTSGPVAVVALFQRPLYLAAGIETYRRIARYADLTVVGVAGEPGIPDPPGVSGAALDEDDPLVHEWSVTVLGPDSGATVVAHDLRCFEGSARSLEHGRTFATRWSFRRADAGTELRRLRDALAGYLPESDTTTLDATLAGPSGPDTDDGHHAALSLLAERLAREGRRADDARNRLDDVDPGAERDPHTGLSTRAFLDRWTAGSAPGTLPIGLILLRVHELSRVRDQYGASEQSAVLQSIARVLSHRAGPTDRVVRIGREEFLLVLPSLKVDELARYAERTRAELDGLSGTFPFVPTPATAVLTRTDERPLPLGPLWAALDRATESGLGVTELRH